MLPEDLILMLCLAAFLGTFAAVAVEGLAPLRAVVDPALVGQKAKPMGSALHPPLNK